MSSASAQSIRVPVAAFEDPVADTRIGAFYRFIAQSDRVPPILDAASSTTLLVSRYPASRREIASAFIDLLARENREWNSASVGSMSEVRSTYYGDLIASVASLKDDRAVTALAGAIGTGNLATDALAALGDAALPATLSALQSPTTTDRLGAIRVLGLLASRAALPSTSPSALSIRTGLLRGLRDMDPYVRASTIESLTTSTDQEVVALISQMAATDADAMPRAAATLWLKQHERR